MGLSSRLTLHARHRHGPYRRPDPRKADHGELTRDGAGFRGLASWCGAAILWAAIAAPAAADRLRVATYNTDLSRDGPGLLLKDIRSNEDPQVAALVAVIAALDADVILLTGIDYDHGLAALNALAARLAEAGTAYPHRLALRPNSGIPTGIDVDGNGRLGEARDAQGFGRFPGEGAMALMSRLPIRDDGVRDFTGFLWADLPGALADPMPAPLRAVQRLSSTGHWDVPVVLPGGESLHLLAYSATPPVFDGPEDRNGRRNHDETAFWLRLLDGALTAPPPDQPFVILGTANLDPVDGDGLNSAITALLRHPAVQDPAPRGAAPATPGHRGDPALATAHFPDGPGGLRVDYVLPSAGLQVIASGVLWPAAPDPLSPALAAASRHRPVWVDVTLGD